eukprot:CAMPEP_0202895912 /NCGR_PEP_ID=MMETSP1392-20130828/5019_1 /ASSEMBLY_ACC=CAM_ASM_000868 /TAXON_ID=225041 /ORGANISM="Chlamydomonas chlamydogama, Strain SAG 11-48b" /LENGTH=49 /DNA_ID=CAMNT_0049581087 /DNA_START=1073 /DNA_END=1222 /DNA_ORIENTATION=-
MPVLRPATRQPANGLCPTCTARSVWQGGVPQCQVSSSRRAVGVGQPAIR